MKRFILITLIFTLVGCRSSTLPAAPLPPGSSILLACDLGMGGGPIVTLVDVDGPVYYWQGSNPIWSTDGTQIAYLGSGYDEEANRFFKTIIEADSAGTEIRTLYSTFIGATGFLKGSLSGILWYSDHEYIFYTSQGGMFRSTFYKYDENGVTELAAGQSAVVSPDGERILINKGIFSTLLSRDGEDLGNFEFDGSGASWSPDGSRIAFVSDQFSDKYNIVILDPASGALNQLTRSDGFNKSNPQWSPGGSRVAYTVGDNTGSGLADALWIIGADGSDPKLLVEEPGKLRNIWWSPDGKQIAYIFYDPPHASADILFAVNIETGARKLLSSLQNCGSVQWQP